ncbi:MAG: cell wall-binding repeat-containing protein [Coriobacteriia bacterium]|nr:cell wall-binding repeat-containing protein [Coriobacteriia bacterium]
MNRRGGFGVRAFRIVLAVVLMTVGISVVPTLIRASDLVGYTQLISVSMTGGVSMGDHNYYYLDIQGPDISSDGRYVVWTSTAADLVPGGTTAYNKTDVFWRDRVAGVTKRVSDSAADVNGNASSWGGVVSGDGLYVAFISKASNLVPDDTNGVQDAFVRNMQTGAIERVSVTNSGEQSTGWAYGPLAIADDDYSVIFTTASANFGSSKGQVYLRDWQAGTTSMVSRAPDGQPGDDSSFPDDITPDGRFVAFTSRASNITGETGGYDHIIVRELDTETTWIVNRTAAQEKMEAHHASLSDDGRYVAFHGERRGGSAAGIQCWVRDIQESTTEQVSRSTGGVGANGQSQWPEISGNGRYVVFDSYATNLVDGDTNAVPDVFRHDRQTGATERMSLTTSGEQVPYMSQNARVSQDGHAVAFFGIGLVPEDTNGQIYVRAFTVDDGVKPAGTIAVAGGADYTKTAAVTIAHSITWGAAGPGQMRHSFDGGTTWVGGGQGWVAYSASRNITLPPGDGMKTVIAEFRDVVGNTTTSPVADSIFLDTTVPGKPATTTTADGWGRIAVTWTGVTDTGSGVASYRVYNGATPISGVLSASARSFTASTLAPGVTASLKVRAIDHAGNYRDSDLKSIAPHIALAGATRYHTAIDTARLAFPSGAATVILATGENFPDALAAAPLAGILDAPILLVPTKLSTASRISGLDATLAYAKSELKASKVIVLGGDIAITPAVYSRIVARFGSSNITRYAGETRYDTANMIIARALSEMSKAAKPFGGTAFLATGANFPDALAAAPISASNGWPVYLTKGTSFTPATKTAMQNAKVKKVVVLGGDLAIDAKTYAQVAATFGSSNVTRIYGATRYDTAAKIATLAVAGTITETSRIGVSVKTKHTWDRAGITTGLNFPDALAGGMLQAKPFGTRGRSVTLLTNPTKLSAATEATLKLRKGPIDVVTFYGGELALSQGVRTSVLGALK